MQLPEGGASTEFSPLWEAPQQNHRYNISHVGGAASAGECDVNADESARRPAAGATFAVVGEVEQKGLQAARAGPELVPHDLAQEDDGDVVLHLKATDW